MCLSEKACLGGLNENITEENPYPVLCEKGF